MAERGEPRDMHFVHLNVHSDYSKGWGIPTIEELCHGAKALGMNKLALTDTNGLYGLIFFIQEAREAGIEPIIGSELVAGSHRCLLLVKDQQGYQNLCRIISARHCDQGFNLIRSIALNRDGLIVISDDFRLLKALKRDGNDDLFVELSPGFQMARCYAFSRKSAIPPVATNRVYMRQKEEFSLHRILRAVALNSKLSALGPGDTCNEHNFLVSPQQMIRQFPHAPSAISNTVRIAEACLTEWDFREIIFPRFNGMGDQEAFERLYQATIEGCKRRYGRISPEVKARVEHEMRIIKEKNFAHYFLVVAEIVDKSPISCGRGSAAASIVSYALGITHVDPIKHNLFFERFLNPCRKDPPDIDVDFPWDEREMIIDRIFANYGTRRAAMVANHNTFAPRAAIREVAKVFGLTEQEIIRVTSRIGHGWHLKEIHKEIEQHPKMKGIQFKKPWDEILAAAARLQGHFNHLSTHCGGLVVVPEEIRNHCPVEISASGLQVLQWEKDSVEDAGLVKIDILGNRSLAVIRDALDLISKNYGKRIDYTSLTPMDDPKTLRIFYDANTFGVFYFESPATRQVLTQVSSGFTFEQYRKLAHFHINVVVTSIIRPASNQCIHTWIKRLHGAQWDAPHPLLRPVLKETLGVMVFQEQLSQAAIHLAGFDPAEADTLRKVVSKKHKEKKLRDFHERFVKGALKKGVPLEVINEVWSMIMGFDGYSFCKPHSASYTMVAYKSAYLRAHYPAEFMAAVISNGGGYYSTPAYISEAKRMGLKLLSPDINESEIKYTGKGDRLRVGFMQLKELGKDAMECIIEERDKGGPFVSLEDFLRRTSGTVHLQEARVLIKAGCFDSLAPATSRAQLIWKAFRFYAGKTKAPALAQGRIFSPPQMKIPHVERSSTTHHSRYTVKHEIEAFGFPISIHPLDQYKRITAGIRHVKAKELRKWVGKYVTTVGWMVTSKGVYSRGGRPMQFITFEDSTALYETVLFPDAYRRYCHILVQGRPYILRGKVQEELGAITLVIHKLWHLSLSLKGDLPRPLLAQGREI